jgi:DNA-binding MarR family transcriptional regulator
MMGGEKSPEAKMNKPVEDGIWKHCNNSAVRRAARQLGQLYDDLLDGTGMRSTQFALLSQIALSRSPPPQKVLAEALVMDLSALGHTLKPLVRDGLVEFVADKKDGRVRRVALTKAGAAKQKELQARWRDAQMRFVKVLGEEEAARIRETMALISSPEFARAFRAAGGETPE